MKNTPKNSPISIDRHLTQHGNFHQKALVLVFEAFNFHENIELSSTFPSRPRFRSTTVMALASSWSCCNGAPPAPLITPLQPPRTTPSSGGHPPPPYIDLCILCVTRAGAGGRSPAARRPWGVHLPPPNPEPPLNDRPFHIPLPPTPTLPRNDLWYSSRWLVRPPLFMRASLMTHPPTPRSPNLALSLAAVACCCLLSLLESLFSGPRPSASPGMRISRSARAPGRIFHMHRENIRSTGLNWKFNELTCFIFYDLWMFVST